jgi:hypothetical protein
MTLYALSRGAFEEGPRARGPVGRLVDKLRAEQDALFGLKRAAA